MESQDNDEDNSEDEEDRWFRKTGATCKEIWEDDKMSEDSEDEEDLWFRKTGATCKEIADDDELTEDETEGLRPSRMSTGGGNGSFVRIPRTASMDR